MITLLLSLLPQQPVEPAARPTPAPVGVQFDANGWPVVGEPHTSPDAKGSAGAPPAAQPPAAPLADAAGTNAAGVVDQRLLASWAPQRPFASLGGLQVHWRLTVHGQQGEPLGVREIDQLGDVSGAMRDRLSYADGKTILRLGENFFGERHGMPWPTIAQQGRAELELFALHLRLPWCLLDGDQFLSAGAAVVARRDQELQRVRFVRRVDDAGPLGPSLEPQQRPEAVDLLVPRQGGLPVEFVHTRAGSEESRRVLLEDWRNVDGVPFAHRRVYLDSEGQRTTTLEAVRVEPHQAVKDRDFRLH